jgi:DNA-binding NarL/FixJ family response regulator
VQVQGVAGRFSGVPIESTLRDESVASGQTVRIYASERFVAERLAAALAEGGHSVVVDGVEPAEGSEVVVFVAARMDRSATARLRTLAAESSSVVVVCERAGSGDVRKAVEAGAAGYVLTEDLEEALNAVVAAALAGQVCVPREGRGEITPQILTTREKQILQQVVLGLTNAQIAARLFLAESTVKSHLSSAFGKLGVSSRNEAVALILDPSRGHGLGILTIPAERIPSPA